jgi:hypothetical protein
MRPTSLSLARSIARSGLLLVAVAALLDVSAGLAVALPPDVGGSVPEINPGVLGSATALLAGGALLIRDRLRKK